MKSHVTKTLTILLLLSFTQKGIMQDCVLPTAHKVLSGNQIKASILNNGNLFWTDYTHPQFELLNTPTNLTNPSTIRTDGIWVAAKNQDNELKLAVAVEEGPLDYDFSAGPIDNSNGQLSFSCENYNRIWEVFGYEIIQHLADFGNDGIINQPILNIYSYPGHQNPYFAVIHGFDLPNTPQKLAPFFDQNNDGIYNPDHGDFPLPEGVASNKIPNHLTWGVFNDAGSPHTQSGGDPLNIEVQLTTFSFYCDENPILNHTIFTSHKIINRGNEWLDSLIFTKMVDFDLGCYADDFVGSIPEMNTFYAYNQDEIDGIGGTSCDLGFASFGTNPPVQTITFLNQDMSSFSLSYTNFLGVPSPIDHPIHSTEFYNLMKGLWPNGVPITNGEGGYNLNNNQVVSFMFPDHPNDPDGWSMVSENFPYNSPRCMGNIEIGQLAPNDFFKVDMGYTLYQSPLWDHLQTVDLAYANIPNLQDLYDNNFENCTLDICPNDCVWTGDANKDSIVNMLDYLSIGLAHGQTGTEREKPLIWQPFNSSNWSQSLYGINLKHTDCNGNGEIDNEDFNWIDSYYGNSYKIGSTIDDYPIGTELSLVSHSTFSVEEMEIGAAGRVFIQLNQAEDIYGLAFTLEFDPQYLSNPFHYRNSPWDSSIPSRALSQSNNESGNIDFVFVKTDGNNSTTVVDKLALIFLSAKDHEFELVQTKLRLKNIRAILSDGTHLNYGSQDLLVTITNPNGTGQVLSNNNLSFSDISIFPNPSTDFLNIKMDQSYQADLTIFDIYGKKVLDKKETNNNDIQLNTSTLSSGIYFLTIEIEGKMIIKKFIKM